MAKKTAAQPLGAIKKTSEEARRPTTEERFAEFSARYKWWVFVPILVGIVIVIVLAVSSGQRKKRLQASLDAYEAARTVEDYEAVAERFPGTFAGNRARARAGDLLLEQGKPAAARERYTAYLATNPDPALGMPVRTAVVQTYIAEENYAGAIEACNAILETPGRDVVEIQALYLRAYCYEMRGDLEAAKAEYLKVLQPREAQQGGGAWIVLAGKRQRELERKLKEKKPEKDVDTPG